MNVIVVGGIFAFLVTIFVVVMFQAMGAWVFLPFFIVLAGIAAYYVREKMRPPEELRGTRRWAVDIAVEEGTP